MKTMAKVDLPYLCRFVDRHGKKRVYVRRNGKRIAIKAKENTPEFAREYAAAAEEIGVRATRGPLGPEHARDTFGWLGAQYFKSKGVGEFLRLAKESQRARRNDLEECFRHPFSETDPDPMGNCPLKYLSAKKVKYLIEAKEGLGAQANRRKHLSALCAWGVENNHLASNPVRDIKAGTSRGREAVGYYTWTVPDVDQFLKRHGAGTKARLALALLLFTGARRQDMVTFGRQHLKGDWLQYVPLKTRYKRRTVSQKPVLPVLADIIATSPCGSLTFLETAQGRPFTAAGFGNWFRDRCNEAGLPQCTAHGLKKAGATIAAENGATTHQLMAMFDWTTVSMAEVYTRAAEQKRLAGDAMFLIRIDERRQVG